MARPKAQRTLLLIASEHIGWAHVRSVLAPLRQFSLVGDARDLAKGLALVRATRPDLVLLAADAEGESLVSVSQRILDAHPGTRLIVIADALDADTAAQLVRLGAAGWLMWSSVAAGDLEACLRSAVSGICVFGGDTAQLLIERRDRAGGGAPMVSDTEARVLEGLLGDWTEGEIAGREGYGERTVQRAVQRLKTKYNVHTLSGLVRKAREQGYRPAD